MHGRRAQSTRPRGLQAAGNTHRVVIGVDRGLQVQALADSSQHAQLATALKLGVQPQGKVVPRQGPLDTSSDIENLLTSQYQQESEVSFGFRKHVPGIW